MNDMSNLSNTVIAQSLSGRRLENKSVILTGAAGSIGRYISRHLLREGAKVTMTGRDQTKLDAFVEELAEEGFDAENITTIVGDCADPQVCRAIVSRAVDSFGKLDVLVNNAGAAWGESFETFPEAGWDKVMNLNVKSIFFLTQAMHGLLKAGASAVQPAKVINIASIDGLRLNPWETYSYQASKAAVINLTKRLAARLIKDGIIVTGIAPGAFASEMNKAARDLGDIVGQHVPAGRIGNDEDMAGVAIYLAARSGNYVVGETIAVDGGVVHAFLTESWEVDPTGGH